MARHIVLFASVLSLQMAVGAVSFAEHEGATTNARAIEVVSIKQVSQKADRVNMAGTNVLTITASTSSQPIQVSLSVTEHLCRFKKSRSGQTNETEIPLFCYELKATDETVHFSRAIWTGRPVRGLTLSQERNAKAFLSWVDGGGVCIEEVGHEMAQSEALVNYLSHAGRHLVPVTTLCGREPFEGLDAIHSDIDIVSVTEFKSGNLYLVVKAPKSDQSFECIFFSGTWHRAKPPR